MSRSVREKCSGDRFSREASTALAAGNRTTTGSPGADPHSDSSRSATRAVALLSETAAIWRTRLCSRADIPTNIRRAKSGSLLIRSNTVRARTTSSRVGARATAVTGYGRPANITASAKVSPGQMISRTFTAPPPEATVSLICPVSTQKKAVHGSPARKSTSRASRCSRVSAATASKSGSDSALNSATSRSTDRSRSPRAPPCFRTRPL